MKSRAGWAVAARAQDGTIHLKKERLKPGRAEKVPLLRGVVILFHTLILGIKALEYSAQVASKNEKDEKPITPLALGGTLAFSFAAALGLFLFLPLYLTRLIGIFVPAVAGSGLFFNLVDGLIRVVLFLAYIWAVGLWKDMARIFEYHGAEHKVIHAFEAGDLSPEAIELKSPRHPRCGTSFLLIVMVLSILVFSTVPQHWSFFSKFLSRIVLIPLIAGLSYEALKASAKLQDQSPLVNALVLPGLLLQKLTTREPDRGQVEVAVAALEGVLSLEGDKI